MHHLARITAGAGDSRHRYMNGQWDRLAWVSSQTDCLAYHATGRRNDGPKLTQSDENHSVRLDATYQQRQWYSVYPELSTSFWPYQASVANIGLSRCENKVRPFTSSVTSEPIVSVEEQAFNFPSSATWQPRSIFLLQESVNFGICRGLGRWGQCLSLTGLKNYLAFSLRFST